MKKEELLDRCIAFSIKINKLRKYLREKQHEYNNSEEQYEDMISDVQEIHKILSSSIKTLKDSDKS